jgi:hypothetical protein
LIKTEYTYNDARRYNRNIDGTYQDPFTELNLDSTQNELCKNASTKSVILAPFNSTMTHMSSGNFSSVEELFVSNRVLKFAAMCRDKDRAYEQNNNKDLDNGVFNKKEEEEDNLDG